MIRGRRLPLFVALALIAAGGIALLQPRAQAPALLPDSEGRIELAVLSVNSARSSTLRNAGITSRIVNSLPEYTRVEILAADREAFTVASNPWPERVGFVDMTERYSLTVWPQDPFVVLRGKDGPRLLASPGFARAEDVEMAGAIARHLDLPVEYSSLEFEGGNIVADSDHAFVGADTIRRNAIRRQLPEREIAARFVEELGKPVIVIGPAPQPIGHIDMMLTPLGDRRLMLADPARGARIAARELAERPGTVAAFERRCEREFFGREDITEITTRDGEILRPPEIVGATAAAIADSEAIAPALERLAQTLTGLGFEILRVPFLYRRPPAIEAIPAGETIPGKPGYPMLTYNNALVETSGDLRRVYLPTYGWAALDDAGAAAWRALEFEVVRVPGFAVNAMYGGALRCSVKVLSRG